MMKYLRVLGTNWFARPRMNFNPISATFAAAALILLGQGTVEAQAWPAPNPYVQSAPYPQSGYQQPAYAPPQQPYAPSAYNQQDPYQAQQQYPQQQYPQQQQQYAQPAYAPPADSGGYAQQPQAQPLDANQLESLVAPIALYPDTLVAQILAAATYPAQVIAADRWRQSIGSAYPEQIAAGANAQSWDPSVKALTAFPQVLDELGNNLEWTTDLGNAYFNQPQDVLQTIQVMRQRAQSAGNLQSTPQEAVNYDQGYIELAPANPQVVSVPAYNPWDVYGQPVQPYSGFSLSSLFSTIGSFAGSSLLHYGPGVAMAAFSHTPFGLLSWAIDWLSQSVLFNHNNYYSQSTSVAHWNLPNRMPRGYAPQGSQERAGIGRPGEPNNRMPRGDNWANRANSDQRLQQPARQPDRFAENRPYEGQRFAAPDRNLGRNEVRPAFDGYRQNQQPLSRPQPYASRPQEAYNRAPEPMRQNFGQAYANRPGESYGFRGGESYRAPAPVYRAPAEQQRGNFGQRYSEPSFRHGYSAPKFKEPKQEKSGGFGGRNSEFAYGGGKPPRDFGREKMPKNFGREKMPKAPHFSEHSHSGGGHSGGGHSGGMHLFGGHHR
jgi:hypothetical protein